MSKAYTQVRTDLADSAAVIAYCAANADEFTLGTIVVPADGAACIVTDAAGTAVDFVTPPAP